MGRLSRRRTGITLAAPVLLALVLALALGAFPATSGARASSRAHFRVHRVCRARHAGAASCFAMKLIPAALSSSDLRTNARKQAGEAAGGARPAVTNKSPIPGNLTPQRLHAAYALPTETAASALQTVAVVDAYNDPNTKADRKVI